MASPEQPTLWTIGHSNLPINTFIENLQRNRIEAVADVRSWPHSRYAPWFDQEALSVDLTNAGITYGWFGQHLGGRPADDDLYLPDGRVRYDEVASTPLFREGLEHLRRGMAKMRVAVLCAEEDPTHCHRRLLVGRILFSDGVAITHIRRTGNVEEEQGFVSTATLFGEEELPWTSSVSVLQKRPRSTSSAG
jgi:uncharacterized protein (DUF488 family)